MLELQDNPEYETFYMVADVHTITTPYDVEELRKNRREVILDYLAAGLDPDKSVLFQQSEVNEHLELAFYFSSVVSVGKMQDLPAWTRFASIQRTSRWRCWVPSTHGGDILIYKSGLVPVGIDKTTGSLAWCTPHEPRLRTGFPSKAFRKVIRSSLTGEGKMSKSVEEASKIC
jgi:tryptophanyl-tRNA synthetase